jgi:RHS repeat-associated protein
MSNVKARLAEAYTGTSSSKITDLGYGYSLRGEVADLYQNTPNSGGYYHAIASYWANGLVNVLKLQNTAQTPADFIPPITYGPEGEGRANTVSAATGQNPVTGTVYDIFSLPTSVTLGSADVDNFPNDPNTGRMTQYKFNIGSPVQSVIGNLTWNQNGTLNQLAITDPFNSLNQQTCTYGYDDLARISSANCGSVWNETFSYSDGGQGTGAFGNLAKTGISGATSFQPTYNTATNRITSVGSQTYSYDANGNLTTTGTGTGTSAYTWDAEGKMLSDAPNGSTTVNVSYDALGRAVEQARGSSYTQIVYGPQGNKLALMNGQTLAKAFVPLPAGATAVYNSSGLAYYRHPDWLGSSRFASTPGRAMYYDGAYAPYGENYSETGTTDRNFTGQNQDTTADLYDFLFREFHPTQGRWLSPDPLTGDIANPQSLNRYGYALNNPCSLIDPLGLDSCNFNIAVNNAAGLDSGQLNAVEAQINAVLGAVASTNGDTVGALFSFTGKADYTLNIVNGNPNGALGTQSYFLGIPFLPGPTKVNAAAIASVFTYQLGVRSQVIGTIGAHELTHRIGRIGDLPPGQGLMSLDALIAQDKAQGTYNAYNLLASPGVPPGLQLTPDQVSALYDKCSKKHTGGGGGGGGGGNDGGGTIIWDPIYGPGPGGEGWVITGYSGTYIPPFNPRRK